VSDIDAVVVDSLKALDAERPIREADMARWIDVVCKVGIDLQAARLPHSPCEVSFTVKNAPSASRVALTEWTILGGM
jgi:hypothetical protein